MKVKICIAMFCMMLVLNQSGFAAMESENYSITTSVISCGGKPIDSENFRINSTLGQATPLNALPYSENYNLDPGFWYTLDFGLVSFCSWDFNPPDRDVDGSDLAEFVAGAFDSSDLAAFAVEFGRINCFE